MTGPLLAAGLLLAAVAVWLLRPRRRPAVEPWETDRVEPPDRPALDRAERAIKDRDRIGDPEDELPGDDWGPGAPG
ncbi:MAG TPA: hypothetical protein VFI39_06495 [Gemmatimonadales bacterium]|nr:hypothetical protein [Gemmatimonadales bacterium]